MKLYSGTSRALMAPSDCLVCPTSTAMRSFAGSHFAATGGAGFSAAGFSAAGFSVTCGFEGAGFCALSCLASLPLNRFDSHPASLTPAGNSADTTNATMSVRRRSQRPEPDMANAFQDNGEPYSAAAIRGLPTKPAASPKRSIITAGRSLALLVTQAPERTA